jgi:para-nitrobenzyl esterase
MIFDRNVCSALVIATLLACYLGCAPGPHENASAPPPAGNAGSTQQPIQAAPPDATAESAPSRGTAPSPLAGTSWRLVKIMSMDDTVLTPDDRALYTLEFKEDGSMSVRADCNRGTGSWTSESEGQLQFGLIAATRAMCPPGSLHDPYMMQFEWVRSYTVREGHLFLATMADGSIIEFEPL